MNRLIDILILNSPSSGLSDMAKLWRAHRTALSLVTRGPTPVAMFSFGEVSSSLHQHQPNLHKHWAQLSWLTTSSPAAESEPRCSEDGRGIPTSRLKCRQVPRMSFRPSFLPATSRNNTGECRRSATLFVPFRFSQTSPDIWDIASSPMSVRKTNKSLFSWYQLHPLFWTVGMTLQTNSRKGRLFAIYTFSKEH